MAGVAGFISVNICCARAFLTARQFNLTKRVEVNVYVKLINFPCFSFSTLKLFSLERAVGDRYKQVLQCLCYMHRAPVRIYIPL